MQFKVPQFIEMESKILGNFTFKQAVYMGGSLGISYVLLKILPVILSIPLIIFVLSFGWALAFLPKKKYGKPFIEITEAAFRYITRTRLYTWKREEVKQKKEVSEKKESEPLLSVPKISGNKLGDISKNLEVGGLEYKE
jgi:hypothetical protein